MSHYLFVCTLLPADRHPEKAAIASATAHAWVAAASLEEARVRMFDHFHDFCWTVGSIEIGTAADLSSHPWNHRHTQPGGLLSIGLERSWQMLVDTGIGSEIFYVRQTPSP